MALLLDGITHTYTLDGVRIAWSVTGVLRAAGLIDFSHVPPVVLEAARARGERVHQAMALLLRDDLDWDSLDDEDRPYVEAGQRFLQDSGFRAEVVEQLVYSKQLRYAGAVDAIGEWGRPRPLLADWKTGHPDDAAAALQTAGYVSAWVEMHPDDTRWLLLDRAAVHLRADGTYRVERYADPNDFLDFRVLLQAEQIKAKRRQ